MASVKNWMKDHHGQMIRTVQRKDNGSEWAPGSRLLDASPSTYFMLGESRRDYRGLTMVTATEGEAVVRNEDFRTTITYTVVV